MSRSKNCLTKIGFPIVSDNRDTLKSLKRVMSRRSSRVIESQLKQIDAIFRAHSADPPHVVTLELKKDKNCDVHGLSLTRRGSMDSTKNLSRKGSTASSVEGKRNSFCSTEKLNENFRKKNRNSIASFTELVERSVTPNGNGFSRGAVEREVFNRPRRESMPIIDNVKTSNGKKSPLHENWNNRLFKGMEHPSNFPNMLRTSSQSLNGKNNGGDRRSSSSWNVNHFHNYNGNSNLDKKQSLSTSEKIFKRDYANGSSSGSSPEPKKELHSILKNKKHDEDDLKEIIKRLSFDYIEKEMSQNGNNKMEVDLLSNSDSSSGGNGRRTPITTFKNMPRRISVDSLDSRRGSRRFSDFTDDDDIVTLRNRFNSNSSQFKENKNKMPLLMFDTKQKHYGNHSKMLLPSSYFDFGAPSTISTHKGSLIPSSSSKMPFSRDFKIKQRDKFTAAYNHPPPLATQQAIAMMEYELGNNLVISNSNGLYKSKLINAVDKKSRNGAPTTSTQYPIYHQQQQQYYHQQQQISKAKRSKSMDDFSTQLIYEQNNRVQRNNLRNGISHQRSSPPSQIEKRSPQSNRMTRPNYHHPSQPQHKNQMRYSVDNLLEIDTSYYNNYQIKDKVQPSDANRPRFVAVTSLEDVQAVRCAEFHPNGTVYAIGSNSKTFRICEYPSLADIREEHSTYQATVLFKRTKHHKGSIYCMAWSPQGDLIATGSNDKTVKLMRYNDDQKQLEGREIELTMHDGTVRDLCFLEDSSNKSSLLISGGAGDCKIYITDCATSTPYQALSGHGSHILSLYNWGGAMFVSGSQDKSVRFWDLRTRGCVNMVTPATSPNSRQGSPVAAVCVDPSGRLLVSGHEDSSCVLYDIRGNRPIQCFKPHSSDIRSVRFSPSAYYLLSASYDNKLVLTDLQGDLTMPLPSVVVAQHSDKVISGRWHPSDFSFLSTSADKTAKLWALPPTTHAD
ncbi:CLUMA_CG009683, isoform A [Clunio marinus]|uniref:CLUMA_CG009683, isoform A n=1 Tax=Clunio marinus TaxID=568069 RepID=A0A1J1ICT9_9DIPT|nr:CLUMA_CG009683, isoform A [Clunio marinus]